jgi:hypothetical protein
MTEHTAANKRDQPTRSDRPGSTSGMIMFFIVLVLVLSLITDLRTLPGNGVAGTDYDDFYAAALAQRDGLNPYDQATIGAIEQRHFGQASFSDTVASPPAFFLAYRPFTLLDPRAGYLLWYCLSGLALLAGLVALRGILPGLPWPMLGLLALSPPTIIAVFLGQITVVLFALYAWSLRSLIRGQYWLGGILAGLALVKPHLMLLPIALLAGLQWRRGGRQFAAWAMGVALLLSLATLPFAEPDSTRHWLQALFNYSGRFDRWQPDLSSLAGFYLGVTPRTLGRVLSIVCVLIGIAGTVLLLTLAARQRWLPGSRAWWLLVGFQLSAWLCLLPYEHPHDDVILLVPLAVLLALQAQGRGRPLDLLALASMIGLPQLDLMGFRPNLTFSYTLVPLILATLALASHLMRPEHDFTWASTRSEGWLETRAGQPTGVPPWPPA